MDAPWYYKFWSYAGLGFIISVGYSASPNQLHMFKPDAYQLVT